MRTVCWLCRAPLLLGSVLVWFSLIHAESSGAASSPPAVIDLSGKWSCRLDPNGVGMKEKWFSTDLPQAVRLPGSLTENGLGDPVSVDTPWTGSIVDKSWYTGERYARYRKPGNVKVPFWLTPLKYYVGKAWYSRQVEVPEAWRGKAIFLFLERCHWETHLWVDGKDCGTQRSLACPHLYSVSENLTPGRHRITLCVDNRVRINVGRNAHSVSDHTQTNWNGIVGALRLEARDPVYLEDVQVFPELPAKQIRVRVAISNRRGVPVSGTLTLKARSFGGSRSHTVPGMRQNCAVGKEGTELSLTYPLGEGALLWDEFDPALYLLEVRFEAPGINDRKTVRFGLRSFGTSGSQFVLNGRKVFLRGTVECCIFPLTGYPPTDRAAWVRLLRRARAHGLNHLRFHSWCPPRAAFDAADELGFFFHVECCAWTTVGEGKPIDRFIYEEGDRILKWYGNHPSFCMLAYGNEPGGRNQREFLSALLSYWKRKDPRRLYTGAAGWPLIQENQYHVTPRPRVHQWGSGLRCRFNAKAPATESDYRDFVARWNVPVVSHEIGQWCAYPNFAEILKYTGVLRAGNFEIFRDSLREHHMLDLAEAFLMASGKLQALCYKEEIEAALRTPGFGGFQLLQLHDFPGQGTALVGVLDAFWDSKGYITPEQFHRFCCETVPLARMRKRVWTTEEIFTAEVQIAHFGKEPLKDVRAHWSLAEPGGAAVAEGEFPQRTIPLGNALPLGRIRVPLKRCNAPCKLVLMVKLPQTPYENDWDLWVYPPPDPPPIPASLYVTERLDRKAHSVLKRGGTVLFFPAPGSIKGDRYGRVPPAFSPIFWNTAWTRRQPPHTLGILCDPNSPLFNLFPTEYHSNWQWWELVTRSQIMILERFPRSFRPVVQVIDDWFTNRRLALVFEGQVEKGKLLACGIDVRSDLARRAAACQFLRSLYAYAVSPAFSPTAKLPFSLIRSLQRPPRFMDAVSVVSADSEAPSYEGRNAIDGDARTIWHTAWRGKGPGFPHALVLDLGKPVALRGFAYLPRQDMPNGRIKAYEVYVSRDCKNWGEAVARGSFPAGAGKTTVFFSKVTGHVRYVRFVALSPLNPADFFASVAELEFFPAP